MKNLILIGLPGSGKTTLGRELAISTGRQFIDLDDIIKQKDGRSVEEIFRADGEAGFRDRETAAIRELKTQKRAVIACGGGVVLKRENVEILSSVGLIVYLDRPVEMILVTVDLSDRPLLREDPCRLFQLQRERRHLYEEAADLIIGCSSEKEALVEATRISKMEETDLRLAVIGDPIAHSRSPEIHLPILQNFYSSVTYSRIQVTADRLPDFLAEAERMDLQGFNVTMPHKQTIVPLLDLVEPEAAVVGAVNTVARNNGAWEGSSTDGKGFSTALLEMGRYLTDSRVTIIGTGGVAATLALRAAWDKALEVRILGRDKEKAARLAAMTNEITGSKIAVYDRFSPNSQDMLPTDILINATPMGMSGTGNEFSGFDFMNGLEPGTLLCDLVYEPEETEFMAEGRRLGFETMGGFSMLVYQALEADRRFTGTGIARTKASRRAMENQKKKGTAI